MGTIYTPSTSVSPSQHISLLAFIKTKINPCSDLLIDLLIINKYSDNESFHYFMENTPNGKELKAMFEVFEQITKKTKISGSSIDFANFYIQRLKESQAQQPDLDIMQFNQRTTHDLMMLANNHGQMAFAGA